MNPEQSNAIKQFMRAIHALRRTKVVRSGRILGDIGEFLCASHFGIELGNNLREEGFDGKLHDQLIQVKYHGGKSTTVNLGNPANDVEVFIVLGPESVLRPYGEKAEYLVYRLDAEAIKKCKTKGGNYHCTKNRLPSEPSARIDLETNGA